jgi:hypothetical protein
MEKKPKDTIIKKLNIKENYKDYDTFYSENKTLIYQNIFSLFKSLKRKDKNNLILVLSTKINGLHWEADLKFSRENSIVLYKEVLPYFELIEDYEICGEINELYNKIK